MNLLHETIKDDNLMQLYFRCIEVPDELVFAHWHHHMEMIYMIEGNMTAHINETAYKVKKGDILLVNPRDIHTTHVHGECSYYLLQIPSSYLSHIDFDWKLIHFAEYIPYVQDMDSINRKLADIFEKMIHLDQQKKKGYQLLFLAQLYQLLYLLYTKASSQISIQKKSRTERDFQRIEQSMQYVKKNYQRQISLVEVAEYLSITPEYFCRLFKKYTGQTFLDYIAQIRLLHFYQDLIRTEESITFLLDRNGITNYKQFMRLFKEAYGTTPHKLRMQMKE